MRSIGLLVVPILAGALAGWLTTDPGHSLAAARAATPGALREAPLAVRPTVFEENGGRYPDGVGFVARNPGLSTWLTPDGFRFSLAAPRASMSPGVVPSPCAGHSVFMSFEGRSEAVSLLPGAEAPGRLSVLTGPRESWKVDLKTHRSVAYRELYAGIDLAVRGDGGAIEYDLLLSPGAALADVVVRVEGADSLELDAEGNLVARTPLGSLRQAIPATWEIAADGERRELEARFRLFDDSSFGFEVPDRDPDASLVIDPTVTLSTFLGGSFGEEGLAVACGPNGCIYVAGEVRAPDFPGYPGPIASPIPVIGQCKSMVTKLDPTGSQVIYTAVVDDPTGIGLSRAHGMKVLANGDVLVAGDSWLGNFTTTPGAYQTTSNGGYEVFVYKVSADFSSLVFSTLLGGSGRDEMRSLCCDANGNIVVVGMTESPDFPTAGTPLQAGPGGGRDGFLAVLDASGSSLLRGTYLGGPGDEELSGCDLAANGDLCLSGTGTSGFPTSAGAAYPGNPGGISAWVGRLDSTTGLLSAGTWFGGPTDQTGWRVECCPGGDFMLAGNTDSTGLPATPGAVSTSGQGGQDVFVARITGDATTVSWATYLGGSSDDNAFDLCVDADCNAYIGGDTSSSDWPRTADAYDNTYGGTLEAFLARVSADGSTLDYSTFLGGGDREAVGSVFCCSDGNVYVTGTTLSSDYPTLPGGVQPSYAGGYSDIFLNCLFFCEGPAASVTNLGPGCNIPGDPVLNVTPPTVGSIVDITLQSIFPNSHYWIWYSLPPVIPFMDGASGCTVYVEVLNPANFFLIYEGFSDANGNTAQAFSLPYNNAIPGFQIIVQARMWAPGGPLIGGDWLSNGLLLTAGCP